MKQTHRHRKQTKGERSGGVWDQHMQTTIYKINNKYNTLYNTRNYIQYPVINHKGKVYEIIYIEREGIEKKNVTESLCCTTETSSIL